MRVMETRLSKLSLEVVPGMEDDTGMVDGPRIVEAPVKRVDTAVWDCTTSMACSPGDAADARDSTLDAHLDHCDSISAILAVTSMVVVKTAG